MGNAWEPGQDPGHRTAVSNSPMMFDENAAQGAVLDVGAD